MINFQSKFHNLQSLSTSIFNSLIEIFDSFLSNKSLSVSLFAAYLWVKSYTLINLYTGVYLYSNIPKNHSVDIFGQLAFIVYPERQEIPIYLSLTVLFAIFIRRLKIIEKYISLDFNKIATILLTLLLFFEIGSYPMQEQEFPILWLGQLVIFFGAMIILSLVRKIELLFPICTLIIIIFITYTPGNPVSYHDYSYFLGPIYEVSKGKSIFTDQPSQYGFLLIQGLGMLTKYKIFSINIFPFFVWLAYVFQYFISFIIIKILSKSNAFAFLSVIGIITLNFLSIQEIPTTYPQIGPIRWLPLIISMLLFRFRREHLYLTSLLFSIVSLFVIDSGVYMYLSLFITYIYKLIRNDVDSVDIKFVVFTILYTIILILVISFGVSLFGYKPILLDSLFYKLKQYSVTGIGMLPMPSKSYLFIFVYLYLFTIYNYFTRRLHENILYIASCSFVGSLYYVGRSHPHNLFNISGITLLFLFSLISIYYKDINKQLTKISLFIICFILFILLPSYFRGQVISTFFQTKIDSYKNWNLSQIANSSLLEKVKVKYKAEIDFLKKDPNKTMLLFHPDDTYLFLETGKNNLLNENPQSAIISNYEVSKALKNLSGKTCPQNIYVSCSALGLCDNIVYLNNLSVAQYYLIKALKSQCNANYEIDDYGKSCVKTVCRFTKVIVSSKKDK